MSFRVHVTLRGDLAGFLHPSARKAARPAVLADGMQITRSLREKAAAKDVIESLGIPHTEVDLIVANTGTGSSPSAVPLMWQIEGDTEIEVHPAPAPADVLPGAPRLQRRGMDRFVVDGHLGKLARNLRLLGFDTAYERDASDDRLIEVMLAENRVLLTRDRPLLMRSVVSTGYCPRSADAEEQTREVLHRFALGERPGGFTCFTRCVACNGALKPVPKADVLDALSGEPLTLRYYDDFHRCRTCGKIFWQGTHFQKLARRIARVTA